MGGGRAEGQPACSHLNKVWGLAAPGSLEEMWGQVACWELADLMDKSLGFLALHPMDLSVFKAGDGDQPAIVTCLC